MRLKSVFIDQYKNLKDFTLNFEGDSFIDIFVGKNATGKSNLFEALIDIFRHIVEFDRERRDLAFNYRLRFEIYGKETVIAWNSGKLSINDKERKTIGKTALPDNVLIYYSGHNDTVAKLVEQYEDAFSKRIKGADFDETRYFIGIGPAYKELLLAVLLIQEETSKAREFICQKLGITSIDTELQLKLKRPFYAKDSKYNIVNRDDDRYWKPEGITKTFLDRLSTCISDGSGSSPARSEGYFPSDDNYILYFNISKIQAEFSDMSAQEFFRQFDNLKTLGMLAEISIPLLTTGGIYADIAHFSDGQFQSVYIYSIVELFKDRNCLTLLDEPDCFLHPEWQFDFLKQVFEIADTAAKNNHVLMSSHSASTITTADESVLNLFELNGSNVVVSKVKKADVIKLLSAGLITFSESEARMNINHILKNTTGAVLFTEGITDEIILETAWSKLYPTGKRRFEVQHAFDRSFLRNLFSRDELMSNFPGRVMFALFDFDEAYDDWNGLTKHCDEITDPHKGMAKQLQCLHHYAMLLPVPNVDALKRQVLNIEGKPWGRGVDSHLSIELLFFKDEWLGQWFRKQPTSGGGELIEFIGDKTTFAKEVVPTLDASCFDVFRPMFEFITSKCPNGEARNGGI